jgi:hypothetical protein
MSFVAVTFVLSAIALLASYVPARRAARVDPIEASPGLTAALPRYAAAITDCTAGDALVVSPPGCAPASSSNRATPAWS